MKRNMDLIRLLLIEVEGEEPKPDLSKFTEKQQVYHLALLIEAGFIHGTTIKDQNGEETSVIFTRLTWAGHEFLDVAKNETAWKTAGERIKKAGVQVTISLLEELLKQVLKNTLGLP